MTLPAASPPLQRSPIEPPPGARNGLLATDGYKFSMAEAGYPLRRETFYYSHRKGGWSFLPIDVVAWIRGLLPRATAPDYDYLATNHYFLGGAYRDAISRVGEVTVRGLPRGSWFFDREPVFSVSGPSALGSWLEPLALRLNRTIQVATCALREPARLREHIGTVTCNEERDIALAALDAVGVAIDFTIEVAPERYYADVRRRAERLVAIVADPDRLFEVGMRAAACEEQHAIALSALRDVGIRRTSNVALAHRLGMTPVGTMGHEHVQRHGSDRAAFMAMRDRFPGFIFYLPDTFDTIGAGIPAALRTMADDPSRNSGIRFDSEHGVRGHYLYAVCRAREQGLLPYLGLESGWNEALTVEFEALREAIGWPADRQGYGIGNYFVKPEWGHFGRDTVSAVYKLCDSGGRGVMKFGDEPGQGKESLPGRPVLWRPHLGMAGWNGPLGFVAQEGENWTPPVAAAMLTGADTPPLAVRFTAESLREIRTKGRGMGVSPETEHLIGACRARRAASIAGGGVG